MNPIFKKAKWITISEKNRENQHGAIYFRKEFTIDKTDAATVFVCGVGYFELFINGKKVSEDKLVPSPSQYDKRVFYRSYDAASFLNTGKNVIAVSVGGGFYDPFTDEVWNFSHAAWRDAPKMILVLKSGEKDLLCSNTEWKTSHSGPIIFQALRNGEYYDARLEMPGWNNIGFDDSSWAVPTVIPGPGGELEEQKTVPCRIVETLPMKQMPYTTALRNQIFDVGRNIAGWARLSVRGEAGSSVTLIYSERMGHYNDDIDRKNISSFVKSGEFQTDKYTLKGDGLEVWEPCFTYHGFRYIMIKTQGNVKIENLEGRVVRTDFERIGKFECSNPQLNKVSEAACRSYEGNFVAIPTDCPHREKNGWTGDAQLSAEIGNDYFDLTNTYDDFISAMESAQRANGQFPGIVPSAGWGYNWGSGPAWDAAMFEIPWQLYVYTGNNKLLKRFYDSMILYMDYLSTMAEDNCIKFGLGDWAPPEYGMACGNVIPLTGYYYYFAGILEKSARMFGKEADAARFAELRKAIFESFNRNFYHGNGLYGEGYSTERATALYFGLVPETEKAATAKALADQMDERGGRADFGILGAKFVPRALADNGFVDSAYLVAAHETYPGWVDMINHGATTIWETWSGGSSLNHIMYGDIAAFLAGYIAGLRPNETHPGFSEVTFAPKIPSTLNEARFTRGEISVHWKKENGKIVFDGKLPAGRKGKLVLPDGSVQPIAGDFRYEF